MARFKNVDQHFGLKEALYYPAVLKGVLITSGHFWVNLWRFILRGVGIKTRKPPLFTISYPEERNIIPNWRGRHRIKMHENGAPKCTACMLCETACPDNCIYIVPEEGPDNGEEKTPAIFNIDLTRCCFCGMCEEACPKDAIWMDTGIMELASDRRENLVMTLPELLNPTPTICTGPEFQGKDPDKVLPHLKDVKPLNLRGDNHDHFDHGHSQAG